MKAQILISAEDHKIICTSHCVGRIHDFQLYKDSCLPLDKDTLIIGDTGYLGLEKIHCKSLIPKKASKKHPLSKEDKYYNRIVSKMRIAVEHSIRFIKSIVVDLFDLSTVGGELNYERNKNTHQDS